MKTTIYGLLGMVKDGKTPKTIVYDGRFFTYDDKRQNYFAYDDSEIDWKYTVMEYINDEIEIIQENEILGEPKGIPEKLDIGKMLQTKKWKRDKKTWETINSIIDYLESKGDE